jgi:hypothetical protein
MLAFARWMGCEESRAWMGHVVWRWSLCLRIHLLSYSLVPEAQREKRRIVRIILITVILYTLQVQPVFCYINILLKTSLCFLEFSYSR